MLKAYIKHKIRRLFVSEFEDKCRRDYYADAVEALDNNLQSIDRLLNSASINDMEDYSFLKRIRDRQLVAKNYIQSEIYKVEKTLRYDIK